MPSPVVIGGGALGAGAIGVGTAYAAGVFTTKYVDFKDYVKQNGLTYIGGIDDAVDNSIKNLLDGDKTSSPNGYRNKLKGQ